jgi:hypothetical protein
VNPSNVKIENIHIHLKHIEENDASLHVQI